MKKFVLFLLVMLTLATPIFAQEPAPVIKELRSIIADAGTGFQSFLGDADGRNEANGTTFYKSKIEPQASISQGFILEKEATKHRTFVLRYNVKDLDAMMLKIMLIMAQKYVDEINVMVKSGSYTGRDYEKADGTTVTEIRDLKGTQIMDYQSSKDQQIILVYGTNGH